MILVDRKFGGCWTAQLITTLFNALSVSLSKLSLVLVSVALAQSTYSIQPPVAVSSPDLALSEVLATSTPQDWVRAESFKFGVNPDFAACIVTHESQWMDRDGDAGHSRGYWQISDIWHPEVSDAIAHSLQSSTDWSLGWIAKGHAKQWSTFWLYCSSTPIFTN